MLKENGPKYLQLKEEMLTWVISEKWKQDEQIPTEHEIASLYSLSRQTVRQAIGELVKDGWLYRVQGKGTFVKARQLNTTDTTQTIGMITTYISDYIFPDIVRGAEAELRECGFRLLLSCTDNDKRKEKESIDMLLSAPLSGLIVEPTKSAENNENLHSFLALELQSIPYIMINESYPELNCPVIKVDDVQGGFTAAKHLIQLGHRAIAGFFKTDDLQGVNRMKGFIEAHREHQISLLPDRIHRYATEEKDTKPVEAALNLIRKPSTRPTAMVCYNDELAFKILNIARKEGLQIPEDLSIVGFDDSYLATATEIKLTTLSHPKAEMGHLAARTLISMIKMREKSTPKTVESQVFKPELIIRNSTQPPKL